jgi:tRNA (guanine37-N1)-methyltransferase
MKQSKLTIKVITLFPEFINGFVEHFGILKKAVLNKLLDMKAVDLRQFGEGPRQTVDDRPYGGGVGMVLRADILLKAIESARKSKIKAQKSKIRTILLCPSGKKFGQKDAVRLANYDELIFVSGRYEGFDERIRKFVDEEISIGDYVLMGGELPALVISEAVMRLRPGILGKLESTDKESFSESMLEYPQYTKPEKWTVDSGQWTGKKTKHQKSKLLKVPKVLLTGHHANVEGWRKEEAEKRTKKRRPDLMNKSS